VFAAKPVRNLVNPAGPDGLATRANRAVGLLQKSLKSRGFSLRS
jgi:hypothetical protein